MLITSFPPSNAQPTIQWDKTIGGSGVDALNSIQQTRDGGYILGGYSFSPISGHKTEATKGADDNWVVKLAPFQQVQEVKSFTLINTESEQPIRPLQDGDIIDLSALPTQKLNIRADPHPGKVGSVRFELSGQQISTRMENQVPYALFGDIRGDYEKWFPAPGNYTLTATPYAQPNCQGQAGIPLTIHFTLFRKPLAPQVEWDKTLGGSEDDFFTSLQQTSDGGYILGGWSASPSSGDKTESVRGDCPADAGCPPDYWVVKLDAAGSKQWDKTIGGSADDMLTSLQQTSDGGYILGGTSGSGISGDKTEAVKGGFSDYWVVKLDAAGNKQWDKTIGGSGADGLTSLQQTSDGGYILGGTSGSNISGDKTEAAKGFSDYWMVKLDAGGNKQWDKTIGGSGSDGLTSLQQTSDGGYILGGTSGSGISGDKTEAPKGFSDYWVVKLDAAGNKQWDKTIGGSGEDGFTTLRQTSDDGYILGGTSGSGISGDKTEGLLGLYDYWIVKMDWAGIKQWDKTIGGGGGDVLTTLQQTSDGAYLLGGWSNSSISGDKSEPVKGESDYWVVKLNAAGNKQWDKTLGGGAGDALTGLQQTHDGGYILGGSSNSSISGDKTEANRGACVDEFDCPSDYWVVKLASFPETQQVVSFTLINTESEQPIRPLQHGDIIDLADLPTKKLNIRADTHPGKVGSVRFELSGQQISTRVENRVPYALFGDVRGDYEKWYPALGNYTLTATPYTRIHAKGKAGTPLTIRFSVVRNRAAAVAARMEQEPAPAQTELASSLTLFPNPTADGRLQLQLPKEIQDQVRYSLLSSLGRELSAGTVNLAYAGKLLEFDFSSQIRAVGVYYLRLEGGNVHQVFKIMRR